MDTESLETTGLERLSQKYNISTSESSGSSLIIDHITKMFTLGGKQESTETTLRAYSTKQSTNIEIILPSEEYSQITEVNSKETEFPC